MQPLNLNMYNGSCKKNIEVTIIKLARDFQLLAKIITPLLITGIFAANKIPNRHGLKFTHMISVFNLVGSPVTDPKRLKQLALFRLHHLTSALVQLNSFQGHLLRLA